MSQQRYDRMLNQHVTISGIAHDAHAGAVVLTSDRTPVYVHGISSWQTSIRGKPVRVTGVLRRRRLAPEPQVDADGAVSHGIEGESYIVENPTWIVEPS